MCFICFCCCCCCCRCSFCCCSCFQFTLSFGGSLTRARFIHGVGCIQMEYGHGIETLQTTETFCFVLFCYRRQSQRQPRRRRRRKHQSYTYCERTSDMCSCLVGCVRACVCLCVVLCKIKARKEFIQIKAARSHI